MSFPQEIKKWGEIWSLLKQTDNAIMYSRFFRGELSGFVVFRKKVYKSDYVIGGKVITPAGKPMIPGENAFGSWAWNYLKESQSLAEEKLNSL